MKSLLRLSLFATLGAGAIVFSCKLTVSQHCTPFPPPSVSGASCSALPKLTKIRDLGNLEPGGDNSDRELIVDDHAIYFTARPTVASPLSLYRIPKAGGDPQVLDIGVVPPIVLDGPSLLYTRVTEGPNYPNVIQLGPQCLFEALPNAGGAISIENGPTVDEKGGVDWVAKGAQVSDHLVLHWDPRTDTTAVIASITNDAGLGFVGDADQVYWTQIVSRTPDPAEGPAPWITTITSEPSAGGAQATLASLPEPLAIIAVDDEAFYLTAPPTPNVPPGAVMAALTRVLKTDGSATTVVGCGSIYRVHDSHVYWARDSKVLRTPKTGGPAEVVFDLGDADTTLPPLRFTNLRSIAFDACNVYVDTQPTNSTSSSIWGAPLPQGSTTSADDSCGDEEGDTDASTADADEQ
jgi:hypothetical protein